MADDLPVHRFASRDELADWLGANAETSRGIWLEICKKGSAAVSVSYADAVELALCHGWIDGQKRALDADPSAAAFFSTLDAGNRYAILYRIGDAKKPETRARRIDRFVGMLARGEKIHR
jgi:uncharacterized protein YdeI (YjbR/CyaY-like superfamily)